MLNTIPIDLVQKNYIDAMQAMETTPGWEVLEEDNLIALKSSTNVNFINVVWGEATLKNINKAKLFFKNLSFNWLLVIYII
ncbi:MAG: hypothetical protein P1U74_00075 [Legionellaceae bacterium]|nr:hypothetical protein [Legionellaceae bacterium]